MSGRIIADVAAGEDKPVEPAVGSTVIGCRSGDAYQRLAYVTDFLTRRTAWSCTVGKRGRRFTWEEILGYEGRVELVHDTTPAPEPEPEPDTAEETTEEPLTVHAAEAVIENFLDSQGKQLGIPSHLLAWKTPKFLTPPERDLEAEKETALQAVIAAQREVTRATATLDRVQAEITERSVHRAAP